MIEDAYLVDVGAHDAIGAQIEFFRPLGTSAEIAALYAERQRAAPTAVLNVLATRVGMLAPDPGGIAVWTCESFAAMEPLARSFDGDSPAVGAVQAGTYHDLGREML